jgi:two-component system sensor kinase
LLVISGFARSLIEKHAHQLDARGKQFLTIIQTNAQNMLQLIDDLLAFSRYGKQPLKISAVDMDQLVSTLFEEMRSLAPERRLQLNLQPLPPAYGDPTLIRQVVANLLSNAIKFTRKREDPLIEIGSIIKENQTVYYVRDNGVGFDMGQVGKLFEAFQRLHAPEEFEGTGIGLATVRCIVQRHGGWVWAEGKINEGATFYFSLPREQEKRFSPLR